MAIAENALIDFFGTQVEITNGTQTSLTDGSFSASGEQTEWTNVDDAPMAMFRLLLTVSGISANPDGGVVNLYAQAQNIDGSTGDQFIPSANFLHTYLGSFPIHEVDASQQILIGPIRLPNYKTSSSYIFLIENQTGVTLGTDFELHIIPMSMGPHPA